MLREDITIRPATKRDLPAVGRLGAELVRLHHRFDPDRFLAPEGDLEQGYAWFLGTRIGKRGVVLIVAEREGEILGYAYGEMEPLSWKELRDAAGFVHDVVVDEGVRRRGIATRLVEETVRRLEDLGAPRVLLWTAAKNAEADRLFERLGFRRTMIERTRERGHKPGAESAS
ncbi:MAG: N-acetyltransferase family protein [Candidatus Eisenbacteria bacterium]